jgi:hypothetical protein
MEAKDFEGRDRDRDFIYQELQRFTPAWIMEARAGIPLQAKSLPHLWCKAEGHNEEMPMEASERRRSAHVGLGIRFFSKLRFGFSVLKNFGFSNIRNRSVF